jgi:hypothetical protein
VINQDVERGLAIIDELDRLNEELKGIEERMKAHGLRFPEKHVELNDPDREGRQYIARGLTHVVPIVFTADVLMSSFKADTKQHKAILDALPEQRRAEVLANFFDCTVKYERKIESGKKFRTTAADVLGHDAPRFITACVARDKFGVAKSGIKIEWDRAKKEAA